jgi:hypothetical protein
LLCLYVADRGCLRSGFVLNTTIREWLVGVKMMRGEGFPD